jgi:tetratricopeptide (TPR) repeat protein
MRSRAPLFLSLRSRVGVAGVAMAAVLAAFDARADVALRLQHAEELAATREGDAAMDTYRAVLQQGHDGAALRYNLGTLAFQRGDIGRAVLHLRAAERLDPWDDDVRHNLQVALAARVDQLAADDAQLDVSRALAARTPPRLVRWGLALVLTLLGAALLARALLGGAARRVAALLAGVAAAATVPIAGLWALRLRFEGKDEAVVVVDEVVARKDAGEAAAQAFIAHAGLTGVVVDERGAFLRLRFDNGLETWLPRSSVELVLR